MLHLLANSPADKVQDMFKPFIGMFILLGILSVVVFITKDPEFKRWFKGWIGEKIVQWRILKKLDPEVYKCLNDLYLPRPDGDGTTQIDHVVISPFGVFVIETKNYSHWIFGSEKQRNWTQQIFKKKIKFQNPLHQNKLHISALSTFLVADEAYFHSLVFFIGSAEFKTELPDNVRNTRYRNYLENYQTQLLDTEQVNYIYNTLLSHDESLDRRKVAKEHKRQLRAKHGA